MRKVFSAVSQIFPFGIFPKITNQKLILPFYHIITDEIPRHIKYLYPIRNIKTFEKDLDFFLKYYKPITLTELKTLINSKISKKVFHLTFDDGLSEFYNIVAPILIKKGIPATVFLNTDFIDNKDLFYKFKISIVLSHLDKVKNITAFNNFKRISKTLKFNNIIEIDDIAKKHVISFSEYLTEKKPYLTTEQIIKLKEQGFTFGSHSINHPFYSDISLDEQIIQTIKSIDFITNKLKIDDKVFAFPFTDFGISKLFFDSIAKTSKIDLTFGTAGLKKDMVLTNLHRIPMENNFYSAKRIIGGEYIYYIAKSLINKNIIVRY